MTDKKEYSKSMNRHTCIVNNKWVYAWGYDDILHEYFYQKRKITGDEIPSSISIFSIGTRFVEKKHPDYPDKKQFSRGELLEIMEKDGIVPSDHLEKLALDLPL